MKINETLIFLREFPNEIITKHLKEGDYDIDALFLPYDSDEIISKLIRLGLGHLSIDDALKTLKIKIINYLFDLKKTYDYMVPDDIKEKESKEPDKKSNDRPDYKELLIIIDRLARKGNYDLNILTPFDAHGILALDFPEVKSMDTLKKEVMEKINVGNEDVRARRQHIWDTCSEEDQNNRDFLIHFIESEDI